VVDVHSTQDLSLVQKESDSEEVELIAPQWSRTGSADGVASVQIVSQLFYNYFTIILQSSVGTLEGHSEVGVYLASFCVPN
jgi:hypothetical protein